MKPDFIPYKAALEEFVPVAAAGDDESRRPLDPVQELTGEAGAGAGADEIDAKIGVSGGGGCTFPDHRHRKIEQGCCANSVTGGNKSFWRPGGRHHHPRPVDQIGNPFGELLPRRVVGDLDQPQHRVRSDLQVAGIQQPLQLAAVGRAAGDEDESAHPTTDSGIANRNASKQTRAAVSGSWATPLTLDTVALVTSSSTSPAMRPRY